MPQTREHFDICRLLRIPRGIVVLTKSDARRCRHARAGAAGCRRARQGVVPGVRADVVDVSATTGEGLDALREAIVAQRRPRSAARPVDGAARLPIDRVFTMKGFGTVVTGTLVSGRIAVDDELVAAAGRPHREGARHPGARARRRRRRWPANAPRSTLAASRSATCRAARRWRRPAALSVTRRVDAVIDLLPSAQAASSMARACACTTARPKCWAACRSPGRRRPRSRRAASAGPPAARAPAVLTRGDRFIIRAYSPPVTIGGGRRARSRRRRGPAFARRRAQASSASASTARRATATRRWSRDDRGRRPRRHRGRVAGVPRRRGAAQSSTAVMARSAHEGWSRPAIASWSAPASTRAARSRWSRS